MKKLLKFLIFIILTAAVVIGAFHFLSMRIQPFLQQEVERFTEGKASFSQIYYEPIHGLVLKNLKAESIELDTVHLRIFPLALFKKEIVFRAKLWPKDIEGTVSLSGSFNLESKRLISKITAAEFIPDEIIKKFNLELPVKIDNGAITIDGTLKYTFDQEIDSNPLDYNLKVTLMDLALRQLPWNLGDIESLRADFLITPDKASTENLSFKYNGIDINGILDIADLLNKQELSARLKTPLGAPTLKNLHLKIIDAILEKIEITGSGIVQYELNGSLSDIKNLSHKATLEFAGMNFKKTDTSQAVNNLKGVISLDQNIISSESLNFTFNNNVYTARLSFNVDDFKYEVGLSSDIISLSSKGTLKRKNLHFDECIIKVGKSNIEVIGEIIDLINPSLNIYAEGLINLSDLNTVFPEKMKKSKVKLDGISDFTLYYKGEAKNLKAGEGILKLSSLALYLNEYQFNNVKISLKLENHILNIEQFNAEPYQGIFTVQGKVDMAQDNPEYNLIMEMGSVNLARAVKDTNLRERDISGLLSTQLKVTGYGFDLNTIKGIGVIQVTDGKLFELPLLKSLAGLLGVSDLEDSYFREGSGHFRIANKYLSTNDLILVSDRIDLNCAGTLAFDSKVNFLIRTNIKSPQNAINKKIEQSSKGKIADILLKGTQALAREIRLTGTVKEPQWSIQPIKPEQIFEGIFKNILR